jgi:ABC-type lipoprotein release transport system permease subunit
MYHALLTNRYLTSRVIPLIAVAAVALCVALVIVVVSVMTGFLNMVKNSGRTLMGDVVVTYPVSGIPHYERLIKRIEALPEAAAATPVVDSFGLLRMPYPDGPDKQTEVVQVWGIEPASFAQVTGYADTLYWRQLKPEQWQRLFADVLEKNWKELLAELNQDQQVELYRQVAMLEAPPGYQLPLHDEIKQRIAAMTEDQWRMIFRILRGESDILHNILTAEQWLSLLSNDSRLARDDQVLKEGLTLRHELPGGGAAPGIAMGMHVSEGNQRQRDGSYEPMQFGYWWMPRFQVILTTIPVSGGGLQDHPEHEILQVVNEFVSGVFLIDDKRVMIPLDVAQRLLHLDQEELAGDPDDPLKVTGVVPPRATMVLVRAKDAITPDQLRSAVHRVYEEFYEELLADEQADVKPPYIGAGGASVKTWVQQQAQFIAPVEKERELMRTLFSIVYIVCAALVLSIFWAIVYEKTRDIGILRSVGASRSGIVWVFLRYGMVVGVIGSIVGVGLGYVVVRNINGIHSALAEPPVALAIALLLMAAMSFVLTILLGMRGNLLPIVLGSLGTMALFGLGASVWLLHRAGGVVIWDPSVYYFTRIPNEMDMNAAVSTVIGAVIFSLLGAVIPAAKAADTDPVHALRYE